MKRRSSIVSPDRTQATSDQPSVFTMDLKQFSPMALSSADGSNAAILFLRAILVTPNAHKALCDLMSKPCLFEFIYSIASEDVSELIQETLLRAFPRSADHFSHCLAAECLHRLGHFFFFLPDAPHDVGRRMRSVELSGKALEALACLKLPPSSSQPVGSSHVDDLAVPDLPKGKHSQRQNKRNKRAREPTVDQTPFQNIGHKAPSSVEESLQLAVAVLEEQREHLSAYLAMLREPSLSRSIRKQYIVESVNPPDASNRTEPHQSRKAERGMDVDASRSAAFPIVLPLKAALYFDNADGFGDWRIFISGRANKDLREARKQGKIFDIIIKKLKELSNGHFSDDNHKRLTGSDKDIPIYEAKMTRDTRLVYQIDCIAEFNSETETQILRIFGIYTHAQLDHRFWESMGRQLAAKGAEYRKRCTYKNRPIVPGDNVYLPASWPDPLPVDVTKQVNDPFLRPADLEELHALLVLEKFVPFSQALLNSIIADQDASHVFAASPNEREIIEHTSSCYVLGRSGTGKTTTMMFKMLGIEKLGQRHANSLSKPRQLFVTQSRVLAGRVEEYFQKLMESLQTSSKSPEELLELASKKSSKGKDELVDVDDDEEWRSDLPKRFNDLGDEHFPLFVTYDKLCTLIEANLDLSFSRRSLTREHRRAERRFKAITLTPKGDLIDEAEFDGRHEGLDTENVMHSVSSLVSYEVFREEYWPHFAQNLTKGLDVALVYSEFMGVIKGSEQSLATPDHFLDKATYMSLSYRTQSTFASSREKIYQIFESYMKRKRLRDEYDVADRTHAILQKLKTGDRLKRKVDFIYVDEAQDNLLVDAQLMRYLCRNPHGLFWAGDTAQTISIGSSFRFNDLKAFLHRMEEKSYGLSSGYGDIVRPKSFQLTMNYRSHGGIVRCADSVIQLICQFWPHSIDILGKERGIVDGMKPVFFTGWDEETVRYEQFLFGETEGSIEFGAQQCILVRNDRAREELRREVGEIGVIMTLYESKGLEFNDVLLFNFFEDSTVDESQWRVVLKGVECSDNRKIQAPIFDEIRHAGVCTELKFLYVALTRARKNLWIVDRSLKGEPMRLLWSNQNIVDCYRPGMNLPKLAETSSPEEWEKSGRMLFQHKRYSQAMHCFDRAGLPLEKAVAGAYVLRERARSVSFKEGRQNPIRTKAFITAAEAFIACARDSVGRKVAYLKVAGDCFVEVGKFSRAAQSYLEAEQYTLATQNFRKAGLFDDAVNVIRCYSGKVRQEVADSVVDVAKLYYFKEGKLEKAAQLFSTHDEALEYMEDYCADSDRAAFLEAIGRNNEAAELHLSEGRTLEAIRLLLADRTTADRAIRCILDGLWARFPLGAHPDIHDATVDQLLAFGERVDKKYVTPEGQAELALFQAIAQEKRDDIIRIFQQLHVTFRNFPAALLALDYYLKVTPHIQVASAKEISSILDTYYIYAELFTKLWRTRDPCDLPSVQRLLGFGRLSDHEVHISRQSMLERWTTNQKRMVFKSIDTGLVVSESDFGVIFRQALGDHLGGRIRSENDACRRAKAFSPCLHFALYLRCGISCCPQEHVDPSKVDYAWFESRIKIHLQQIKFLQSSDCVLPSHEQAILWKHWLSHLYEACNPPLPSFGNISLANSQFQAVNISQSLTTRIRDSLYSLNPLRNTSTVLTTALEAASLCSHLHNDNAAKYWVNAPIYSFYRPFSLMREGKKYIVEDLFTFVSASSDDFIGAGISFIEFVNNHKTSFDMNIICHFIDVLCGGLAVAAIYSKGGLNNVTLPRSWLLYLVPRLELLRKCDFRQAYRTLGVVRHLIQHLYTADDGSLRHMTYLNRNISNHSRSICIYRLCRSVSFLGYNINSTTFRNDILGVVTQIRNAGPGREFPAIYARYVKASIWSDLSNELRNRHSISKLDEVIQLIHSSQTWRASKPTPAIKQVVFPSIPAITSLLTTSAGAAFSLTATATPFTPSSNIPSANIHDTSTVNELATSNAVDNGAEDNEEENDEYVVERVDATELRTLPDQTSSGPALPTDEEIKAVHVLQKKLRAVLDLRKTTGVSSLKEARLRYFQACLSVVQRTHWEHSPYRLLYLGPLPHVLVVTEGLERQMKTQRDKAKKRLVVAQHLELEHVKVLLNAAVEFRKRLERLKKLLTPDSQMHRERDVAKLRLSVLELDELSKEFGFGGMKQYDEDLKIGLKGIVQESNSRRSKPKPDLNVDDL
ncbi:hypothetical protein BD410DRAFT_818373 [Rickenella mellea]|uniref:UvrD-like helicase ATP-binding domain-containing protein n=1 Tax=Rickenella mellea TaxID=50990 RepID=A0A4Y7QMU4_9AGAM|nr:hypothetical protein BD410DRAFT_818373 [Rickenella mellea]